MRGVLLVPNERRDVLWLDDEFAMNYYTLGSIDNNHVYFPTNLGGVFTSPPAAVTLGQSRLDVFGLGTDFNVYHKVFDATSHSWTPVWENLGGNFTCTPVVLSAPDGSIDLFGLGADQGMLHRKWDGSAWGSWKKLGGCFTSLPVLLPNGTGGFDIFARGLDFMLYYANWTPNGPAVWELLGGGLLGEPTAASAPAAVRVRDAIFVFVAGADGAIWYLAFDGAVWTPWISLGPAKQAPSVPHTVDLSASVTPTTFFSEPVVTAFFSQKLIDMPSGATTLEPILPGRPGRTVAQPQPVLPQQSRVDVFAVGIDTVLYHKWLDEQGWHGDTDSSGNETGDWAAIVSRSASAPHFPKVTSSFACAPSIVAPNQSSLPNVIPPVHFEIVEPNPDGKIHVLTLDSPLEWRSWDFGPHFRLPSYYTFSLDAVQIDSLRSNGNLLETDTDLAAATLSVGKWPILSVNYSMGDVSTGGWALYNMTFRPLVVELCEPVMLTYSIVNSGNSDITNTVLTLMLKAGSDFAGNKLGALVSPQKQTIALDLGLLTDTTFITAVAETTLIGTALGAALSAGLQQLVGLAMADCDGVVASEPILFQKGRNLWNLITTNGQQGKYSQSTRHLGSDSASGCGGNSNYVVYWSITESKVGP